MRKLIFTILSAVLLLGVVAAPASAADSRCGGKPGLQAWQDRNKNGPSVIFCSVVGSIYVANLSNVTTNLQFFANWNDRISSVETFNFNSNFNRVTLWPDRDFKDNSEGPDHTIVITGNTSVHDLGAYWTSQYQGGFNDRVSSIRGG